MTVRPACTPTRERKHRIADVVLQLDRTNRNALPRFNNPNSGPIFARLTNPANVLALTQTNLPGRARIQLFNGLPTTAGRSFKVSTT
jgi:hypothetical protein